MSNSWLQVGGLAAQQGLLGPLSSSLFGPHVRQAPLGWQEEIVSRVDKDRIAQLEQENRRLKDALARYEDAELAGMRKVRRYT